jgi:hypothetical protein
MSDNQQMSVTLKRLFDFISMVTHKRNVTYKNLALQVGRV